MPQYVLTLSHDSAEEQTSASLPVQVPTERASTAVTSRSEVHAPQEAQE